MPDQPWQLGTYILPVLRYLGNFGKWDWGKKVGGRSRQELE
ncbi:MAG: hypothetical protein ACP5RH_22390 [Leptodesmis sp.]